MYDVAHHTLHYLNTTALFILSRCDGQRQVEDIAADLLERHALDAGDPGACAQILSDVRQGLAKLAEDGLLEPDDGPDEGMPA